MINTIIMVYDEPTLLLFYQNFMSNIKIYNIFGSPILNLLMNLPYNDPKPYWSS